MSSLNERYLAAAHHFAKDGVATIVSRSSIRGELLFTVTPGLNAKPEKVAKIIRSLLNMQGDVNEVRLDFGLNSDPTFFHVAVTPEACRTAMEANGRFVNSELTAA